MMQQQSIALPGSRLWRTTVSLATALWVCASCQGATYNVANGDVAGLIAAIGAANATTQADTINLAAGGVYTLSTVNFTNYWTGPTGLPVINSPITINGNGATIRRSSLSGTPDFRILYVGGPNADLTLNQVTISGGRAAEGAPGYMGGGSGIRVETAKLTLLNSTVRDNGAASGSNDGGGIFSYAGQLTVVNSTITGNTSYGGRGGGGILIMSAGGYVSTTLIVHSTIAENRADAPPGFRERGDALAGGGMTVRNSILGSPGAGIGNDCYGAPISQGYNIASDASCTLTGPGDLNNTDPLVAATADNGGPTHTMALLAGSPALDRVPVPSCVDANGVALTTDQRGLARPQGTACDSGALELSVGVAAWTPTGTMARARFGAGVAKLPSGRILVAGGHNFGLGYLSHTEIYDPATGLWTTTQAMPHSHRFSAVALADGDVLMLGDDVSAPATAYRYRESTGMWSSAGNPSIARFQTVGTLLPNGKVLVAGGYVGGCCIGPAGTYASAELYDPVTNQWSPLPLMSESRFIHSATLLANGKVLVAGGAQRDGPSLSRSSADLFDPVTSTWAPAAPMANARAGHTGTRLPNGKVLVTGGFTAGVNGYQATAEIFDSGTNTWSAAPAMLTARARHEAVLLPSGKVLVVGGETSAGPTASAELYDPVANTWSPAPSMGTPRNMAAVALLPGGRVLAAGGILGGSREAATAEVYEIGAAPDLTPPVITAPPGVSANATSPAGVTVNYSASATDDSGSVASFACLPASGSIFPIGDSVVTCTATDGAGNSSTKSFTVHVAGASEQIAALEALIQGFGLPKGIETSLLSKLKKKASCDQLAALINQTQAQSGKALTVAQANQVIVAAMRIRATMGC